MLSEFSQVKQEGGPGHRRWFQADGLELIVWYDRNRAPEGFQLCYQASGRKERALTWRPGQGFSHAVVESGDTRPDKNMTPILMPDGPVPWVQVEAQFREHSEALEPALRDYVLAAFNGRAG
jgi:hypothetical protein